VIPTASIARVVEHPLNLHANRNGGSRKMTTVMSLFPPGLGIISRNNRNSGTKTYTLVPQEASPEFIGRFLTVKTFNYRGRIVDSLNVPAVQKLSIQNLDHWITATYLTRSYSPQTAPSSLELLCSPPFYPWTTEIGEKSASSPLRVGA
jgi:hypothetical protein